MEVLSCSELQFGGESNSSQRSPGTKPSNNAHEGEGILLENGSFQMENNLLKVDFPEQWPGDKPSNGLLAGGGILRKEDFPQEMPGEEPQNLIYEGKGNFMEVEVNREEAKHPIDINLPPDSNFLYDGEDNYLKQVPGEAQNCIYEDTRNCVEVEDVNKEDSDQSISRNLLPDSKFLPGKEPDYPRQVKQDHDMSVDDSVLQKEYAQKVESTEENGRTLSTLETFHVGNYLSPKHKEGDEEDYPEQDVTVALWVKWRGKWQAGIKCSRADCPLPTLRAKPTRERKKYFVVFFPHTRIHSWADMLLVRPIKEAPVPLAYGTHHSGKELVKDLSIPRRYIMQKLAVSMLDISDQLHTEAVIESARKVTAWKEFAMEASRCQGYSDLGRMLLKLQSMIMTGYIAPDWLEHSFNSWAQRCQNAKSAEAIETLSEELVDSVIWSEVSKLWDEPVQPNLGVEWKTWKQEVMKWFSTSHPVAISGGTEHRNYDNSVSAGFPISKKRQKLAVRRAETNAPQVDGNRLLSHASVVKTDTGIVNYKDHETTTLFSKPHKDESLTGLAIATRSGWDGVVVENGLRDFNGPTENVGTRLMVNIGGSNLDKKYRQCVAFIEAKGRQCGRWANDGGIYCCVHLNSRSLENAPKFESSPSSSKSSMCEGMTNHGQRCKHRSRNGSLYCLKHMLQNTREDSERPSSSSANNLKRKHGDEGAGLEILCRGVDLVREDQNPPQETPDKRNGLTEHSENSLRLPRCIGWCRQNNDQCKQRANPNSSYCEKHIPSWLRRGRKSRSRIISAEVFKDLLKNSSSGKQKAYLHRACELLHEFVKNSLSTQSTVSKENYMDWILAEACKDLSVGECLLKVVSHEREKLGRLWGFDLNNRSAVGKQVSCSGTEIPVASEAVENISNGLVETGTMKCKLCSKEFSNDQGLGAHWMEVHKKEMQWFFRGYACPICKNSFTNRKVLNSHMKETHAGQVLEQSILFVCIPCNTHFVNLEHLWLHVLSAHYMEFRLPRPDNQLVKATEVGLQDNQEKLEITNRPPVRKVNRVLNQDGFRKYTCRFCGLKFDLLPDLGRHHQAAHMSADSINKFPPKRGTHLNVSKQKSGRILNHPRFKKGLGTAFGRIRNSRALVTKRAFPISNVESSLVVRPQPQISETVGKERSVESYCSAVADILFAEIQKTKSRPSNLEILAIARSTCCKVSLQTALEEKYGVLPERLYLKAAKLCSELNIRVEWHQDGFVCPKGCKPFSRTNTLVPLMPLPEGLVDPPSGPLDREISTADLLNSEACQMDESHYILNYSNFKKKHMEKAIVLCEDLSFGRETVPVACVVDEDLKGSLDKSSMPWMGFSYLTERLLDPSLGLDTESSQLGCACPHPTCSPEMCDHVYLFDNDYDNAEDIHGQLMHGRFPYDEAGRVILEEGYMVYECNSLCSCDKTCQNRVLQKGVQVKLEVYKTKNKGWAVRAGEAILRGTFICEYIGEVLNDQEANKRGERYDNEGCSYLYDIDAHIDMSGLNEEAVPYVIDATKYGNVARFINHSCSPNLVNYQVLVESMDCQLAHIGLYARQDISVGEELAYDYRYKLLPGKGCPCHCGAASCRGRLY